MDKEAITYVCERCGYIQKHEKDWFAECDCCKEQHEDWVKD